MKLRPKQIDAINGVRGEFYAGKKRVIFVGPTGFGKCLGRGTPVLMYSGKIKPVEDVEVGDFLMGPDSSARMVTSTCIGTDKLYRVCPVKGDSYVTNGDHILSLKLTGVSNSPKKAPNAAGKIVNVSVDDYIKKSNTFKHTHKGWRTGVDFPERQDELKIDPYFLGLWLGDGNSNGMAITTPDAEIVDYIHEFAASRDLNIRVVEGRGCASYYLTQQHRTGRGGTLLMNAAREYGIINNKRIPDAYKYGSREVRMQVLAGILDTDGSYDGRGFDFVQKSEELFDDILFVVRSLGFAAYKKECVKTCTNNGVSGTYFRMTVTGDLDTIPTRVKRKQAQPRKQKKSHLVTGLSIEPLGVGEYFGFELAGNDRMFLLGDFTVTHNTIVFSTIAKNIAAKEQRALILVHRHQLLKQASESLSSMGVKHDLFKGGGGRFCHTMKEQIMVASIQSYARHCSKLPDFDLIIIDEAHRSCSASYRKVFDSYLSTYFLGVTATPKRLDGQPLGDLYEAMVHGPTTKELIDDGYLSPYRAFIGVTANLNSVGKSMGDYNLAQLSEAMKDKKIVGDCVKSYRQHANGLPAIAFCVNIAHAQETAQAFRDAGYRAIHVEGGQSKDYISDGLKGLASGAYHVICSCDLISEGVDVPVVTAAILLRPTMSIAMARQQIGRIMRPMYARGMPLDTPEQRKEAIQKGVKPNAIILDHAGVLANHGLPDADVVWSLEGETKKKGKSEKSAGAGLIRCECQAKYPAALSACPRCGKPKPGAEGGVEAVDGEMLEITEQLKKQFNDSAAIRAWEIKTKRSLEKKALDMGYKSGWVHHRLQAAKTKMLNEFLSKKLSDDVV
jgi:superfamily II DNA or RNA helicase